MARHEDKEGQKIRRLVTGYNMIANLFWSAINLAPIAAFCYKHIELKLLFLLLAIGLVPMFLPNVIFDRMQFARTTSFYKKIGVDFVNYFAQNGEFVNKLVKKKFPRHRIISVDKRSINKLLNQTYMFEKFHFMMFLIFTFVIFYALFRNYVWWALIIFINNVVYNIYPNFLQQYIRVRLKTVGRRA